MIRALFTTSGAVVLSPVGSESPVDSIVVTTTDDVDVMELSFGTSESQSRRPSR